MAHSKRNTSLAFFTSYERSLLKTSYGTQRTRLTRDSFRPFSSCTLCLSLTRDPVSCPHGDLFCRECAVENLLAQRKEIERIKKSEKQRLKEEEEQKEREREEAERRAVEEFERVQQGLEARGVKGRVVGREGGKVTVEEEVEEGEGGKRGKRKFELDEGELRRVAQEEDRRVRAKISEEKVEST